MNDLEHVTLGAMVTLVKLRGSGAAINGVTKPEGWPWSICIAVGKPGNMPAVELARAFGAKLQELGAPVLAELVQEKHYPTYQELMDAVKPFAKVAAVAALFTPPLSARHRISGRALPVYQLEHPGNNEHEQRYAELTAQDFETLHIVVTGKVPEGW